MNHNYMNNKTKNKLKHVPIRVFNPLSNFNLFEFLLIKYVIALL